MKTRHITCSILASLALLFVSCDKGYDVRFTNYYIEPMDSLIVGNHQVVFTDTPLETTTEYFPVTRGRHSLKFVTRTQKVIYAVMDIPSRGSGKRTIQIDGIEQVSVFEEE
jgi:hypothetical protein